MFISNKIIPKLTNFLFNLTHDKRANFINKVKKDNNPSSLEYICLREYIRMHGIILNMSDNGDSVEYLIDGRFVINDFYDKMLIKDHKIFKFKKGKNNFIKIDK